MKITIALLVSLCTIIALTQAQDKEIKSKGAACTQNSECGASNCIEGHCGCKVGHMPQYESHSQDSNSQGVEICVKVIGTGCNHDPECYDHLPNAKCDQTQNTCVCNVEDDCTDGAMTLTVMSITTMMALVIGMLKVW